MTMTTDQAIAALTPLLDTLRGEQRVALEVFLLAAKAVAPAMAVQVKLDEAVTAQRRQHFQTLVAQCTPAAMQCHARALGPSEPASVPAVVTLAEAIARRLLTLEP